MLVRTFGAISEEQRAAAEAACAFCRGHRSARIHCVSELKLLYFGPLANKHRTHSATYLVVAGSISYHLAL